MSQSTCYYSTENKRTEREHKQEESREEKRTRKFFIKG